MKRILAVASLVGVFASPAIFADSIKVSDPEVVDIKKFEIVVTSECETFVYSEYPGDSNNYVRCPSLVKKTLERSVANELSGWVILSIYALDYISLSHLHGNSVSTDSYDEARRPIPAIGTFNDKNFYTVVVVRK